MTIGGNTTAIVQVRTAKKNAIGESVPTWVDAFSLFGWLDLSGGDSNFTYNAKVQQSTHIFLCDFQHLTALTDDFIWDVLNFMKNWIVDEDSDKVAIKVTSENSRMVIGSDVYNINLIDDPMGMHQHLEIYLEYIGGGLGVS